MVYCVAFGCNSNSCSSENISFFCFPADAAQRREWRVDAANSPCWLATVSVQPPVFLAFFHQLFRQFQCLSSPADTWQCAVYILRCEVS